MSTFCSTIYWKTIKTKVIIPATCTNHKLSSLQLSGIWSSGGVLADLEEEGQSPLSGKVTSRPSPSQSLAAHSLQHHSKKKLSSSTSAQPSAREKLPADSSDSASQSPNPLSSSEGSTGGSCCRWGHTPQSYIHTPNPHNWHLRNLEIPERRWPQYHYYLNKFSSDRVTRSISSQP